MLSVVIEHAYIYVYAVACSSSLGKAQKIEVVVVVVVVVSSKPNVYSECELPGHSMTATMLCWMLLLIAASSSESLSTPFFLFVYSSIVLYTCRTLRVKTP
jgi:hypothetical protein